MRQELWRLSLQGIRGRRRSSLLLLLVLLLSFAFATITLSVTDSINQTNVRYREDTYGSWYATATAEEIASGNEWLGTLGTTRIYGQVGSTGIGTVDDALVEIGHISLSAGRFPAAENEIAIEAATLSLLDYDYSLGQEVLLAVQVPAKSETAPNGTTVTVFQTYTLVGILREYSDLWGWDGRSSTQLLCGALLTEPAAETLLQAAEEAAAEAAEETGEAAVSITSPSLRYFFTLAPDRETDFLNAQIYKKCKLNSSWSASNAEEAYHTLFIALILAVTWMSVVCIYTIQLSKQVRQNALFRSIGITRRQLRRMTIYETICLCIPAMLLGAALGSAGVWLILKRLVYSSTVAVQVSIPYRLLLIAAGVWLAGILGIRLLILQISLHAPLTGRIHMAQRKSRFYRRMKKAVTLLLSGLLCATVVFSALESAAPAYWMNYWSATYSYRLSGGDPLSALQNGTKQSLLTEEILDRLRQLPGVREIAPSANLPVRLTFSGAEDCALYCAYLEDSTGDAARAGEIAVILHGIPTEQQKKQFESRLPDMDWEAFEQGRQVILTFCRDSEGNVLFDSAEGTQKFADTGLSPESSITMKICGRNADDLTGREFPKMEISPQVGGIVYYDYGDSGFAESIQPYQVYCSAQFMKQLLAELDASCPNQIIGSNSYLTGTGFGYTTAVVYTDLTASYLSTDYAMANQCAAYGLSMANYREEYASYIQGHRQTLILLLSTGACIAGILLLILGSTLALEAQEQRRTYGILRALGLSRRQMKGRLWKQAIIHGLAASLLGWLIYAGYFAGHQLHQIQVQKTVWGQDYTLAQLSNETFQNMQLVGVRIWWLAALTAFNILLIIIAAQLSNRSLLRRSLMEQDEG